MKACGAHDVSKQSVMVARRSAERIGPTIIVAPQRGHAHAGRGAISLVAVVSVDALAAGQVFARNPDCRMRTKPRGRMCWTNRRRNSMAESIIVRR
jgi:hypothetical protein